MGPPQQPPVVDIQSAQERRRAKNDRATRDKRAVPTALKVGDDVVIRDKHPGWKLCPPFEREWRKVISIKGTMITAQRGQSQLIRNVTWFV